MRSACHSHSTRPPGCVTSMFLYMLIFMAYHGSRWIPRNKRLKFQILNAVFIAVVLVPQFYVLTRPKSSRYCRQPLLNNLSASIALSFIASGFSVIFTLLDPVPQSLWASYHVFGLLSCGQGLCTAILTLTAAACANTTPELYYTSLVLTAASIFSTGFFMVRGGLWLARGQPVTDLSGNNVR
ncbi:Protein LZIC [Scophthalmus maximus]|uniref:Protein LZIC n=1 Tax=Scophthalmus maximus TaxID=52904 RepID=A0A2U9BGI0_SCOMX|nr:Protein LZIC [Scophthalmus maximus]